MNTKLFFKNLFTLFNINTSFNALSVFNIFYNMNTSF